MVSRLLSLLIFFFCLQAQAEIRQIALHVNQGEGVYMDSLKVPMLSYNSDSIFSQVPICVFAKQGDSVEFLLSNHTNKEHGFSIQEIPNTAIIAQQSEFKKQLVVFEKSGVYTGIDQTSLESQYLGLKFLIVVDQSNEKFDHTYIWSLREFSKQQSIDITQGEKFSKGNYKPDYFSINGLIYPENMNDSLATITGQVGDRIRLVMYAGGMSRHSIHFHGYHVAILSSSSEPQKVGYIKDTVPIKSGEIVVLELIPDKPGQYPVHNHNLVAVTSGGIYPNGQFSIMTIGN